MRSAAAGVVRGLRTQGARSTWIGSSRRAPVASSAAPTPAPPPAPSASTSAVSLAGQSPFWTLCGVLAIGVSAAAVGQRAAVQDVRAARAEQRNAAAEAYASARAEAEARGAQLAAVEAAARRELEAELGSGARRGRRPWREVSEELWAAMSERR